MIELAISVIQTTDLAILVETDAAGDGEVWLPKSMVKLADYEEMSDPDELCPGHEVDILIPDWLAEEKELV